jgi:NAD(P)-dependent dehydrogenase (short-subunit alcohol dehydrogenase family)
LTNNSLSRFELKDRVIVITGGAGLLGVMHAESIAGAGGTPVLADLNGNSAEKSAASIAEKFGVPTLGIKTDITGKASVEKLRDAILNRFGRIDGLINNAANNPKMEDTQQTTEWSRFENFSLDAWEQDMSVGLKGAFLCSQVLGLKMAEQGKGVIVNISSDLGLVGPDQRLYEKEGIPANQQPVKPVTYSVIKSGLIGLTRYLATYWATKGVRVNAVCPGGVEAGQPEDFKERLHSRIPMNRMAKKDEFQGTILFLVSDASSYMTGATLAVDGGRTCW